MTTVEQLFLDAVMRGSSANESLPPCDTREIVRAWRRLARSLGWKSNWRRYKAKMPGNVRCRGAQHPGKRAQKSVNHSFSGPKAQVDGWRTRARG